MTGGGACAVPFAAAPIGGSRRRRGPLGIAAASTWLLAACSVGLLSACLAPRAPGTLELRLRLAPSTVTGLDRIEVMPEWGGASRGPERDAGWQRVPALSDRLALPGSGEPVLVARGQLAPGRYDRVHVAVPRVTALDRDGATVTLLGHIEPIARGFEIAPGETLTVDIELIVLPGSSIGDGRPEMFVKDARLVKGP